MRIDTRPRHRNSGRQNEGKRFASHLQWLRGRPCLVSKEGGCSGKIEAAHVDHAGGKGMSLKVCDTKAVPLCAGHHAEYHRGARTFEAKYRMCLVTAAATFARLSPHRHLWEQRA